MTTDVLRHGIAGVTLTAFTWALVATTAADLRPLDPLASGHGSAPNVLLTADRPTVAIQADLAWDDDPGLTGEGMLVQLVGQARVTHFEETPAHVHVQLLECETFAPLASGAFGSSGPAASAQVPSACADGICTAQVCGDAELDLDSLTATEARVSWAVKAHAGSIPEESEREPIPIEIEVILLDELAP